MHHINNIINQFVKSKLVNFELFNSFGMILWVFLLNTYLKISYNLFFSFFFFVFFIFVFTLQKFIRKDKSEIINECYNNFLGFLHKQFQKTF